jgi:cell division protein FtsL
MNSPTDAVLAEIEKIRRQEKILNVVMFMATVAIVIAMVWVKRG